MSWRLRVKFLSDATFGRGDGVVGLVDAEIEHDPSTGLPYVRGRVLKGLMVEECSNILYSLRQAASPGLGALEASALKLFGESGSARDEDGVLQVGAARMPESLRRAVEKDISLNHYTAGEVLESLTWVRRQTAVDETGVPEPNSLRSMRVAMKGLELVSELRFTGAPNPTDLAMLAACAASVRRGGTGRNRGRGRLSCELCGEFTSADMLAQFSRIANGGAS